MANLYIEPKGRSEGSLIEDYVVEDHAAARSDRLGKESGPRPAGRSRPTPERKEDARPLAVGLTVPDKLLATADEVIE